MSLGPSAIWPFPVPEDDPTFMPPEILPAVPSASPVEALPAPPVYEPPDLLSAPPAGFRERLGASLALTPAFRPSSGTSGAQAFLGGLLSGGARSFGQATVAGAERSSAAREQTNTVRKAEADRNWSNAQETWRARLREHYKAKPDPITGKVKVTREMASAMGVPSAEGTMVDPVSAGNLISRREQAGKNIPRVTSPKTEKPVVLRWSPVAEPRIRSAQSALDRARKAYESGTGDEVAVAKAAGDMDELRKRDFASQIRAARTREQVQALAQQALDQFPEWENSPMIDRVVDDKLRGFRP